MNTLNTLFELISDENVKTLTTDELGQNFLLALDGESDIYPFNIVDIEFLVEAIDNGRFDRYTGRRPRSDSEYDDILFALMEAWQWLLSKAYIAPKPRHTAKYHVVMGETNYFITQLGHEYISKQKSKQKPLRGNDTIK